MYFPKGYGVLYPVFAVYVSVAASVTYRYAPYYYHRVRDYSYATSNSKSHSSVSSV